MRGTTPITAQLNLLRWLDREATPVAVDYGSLRVGTPGDVLGRMRLAARERPGRGGADELLALPWIPAGIYRVRTDAAMPRTVSLSAGAAPSALGRYLAVPERSTAPQSHVAQSPPPPTLFELPVPVLSPVLASVPSVPAPEAAADGATDQAAEAAASEGRAVEPGPGRERVWLDPVSPVDADESPTSELARQVRRYGAATVYLIGEGGYLEPAGFWIAPGVETAIVIRPDARGSTSALFVRNAPVANRLSIITGVAGGWRRDLDLAPGEERMVEVPRDPSRSAMLLRLRAARGFRPAHVEPASQDFRNLGCWFEVR